MTISCPYTVHSMMTSSNGNICRVTAVNSPHKGQWRGALMFFCDLRLNKRVSKQSRRWWLETSSRLLWRYCNVMYKVVLRYCHGDAFTVCGMTMTQDDSYLVMTHTYTHHIYIYRPPDKVKTMPRLAFHVVGCKSIYNYRLSVKELK